MQLLITPMRKEAFARIDQARIVLEITFDQLLRSYFLFHQDLLFHSSEIKVFNAFFIGRAFEVVLKMVLTSKLWTLKH